MRSSFLMLIFVCLISFSGCRAEQAQSYKIEQNSNAEQEVLQLGDSTSDVLILLLEHEIEDPYVYVSEISVIAADVELAKRLEFAINRLSENNNIKATVASERMEKKLSQLIACNDSNCEYLPEGYTLLSHKGDLINILYEYNYYMSTDNWVKYAVFNAKVGERMTYNQLFTEPTEVLGLYEQRYVSMFQGLLDNNTQEDDEQIDEYEAYTEHLEIRKPFSLDDLNNLKIIYSPDQDVVSFRFHYRGQGGNYRLLFPNDYIEFSIAEILPFLRQGILSSI